MSGSVKKESIREQLNGHVPAVSASVLISMIGTVVAVWAVMPLAFAKDLDKVEVRLAHHTEQPMHKGSIGAVADINARLKALEREQQEFRVEQRETQEEVKAIRRDIGQGFQNIIRKLDSRSNP